MHLSMHTCERARALVATLTSWAPANVPPPQVRPLLEALVDNGSLAAPPRAIKCESIADVDEASRHPPCIDSRSKWCRSRAHQCNRSAAVAAACNVSCGICVPRGPHPSVVGFLRDLPGYRRWRICGGRQG